MLKIGVLGAGHLGKIHLKILQDLTDQYELVGFHDPDLIKAEDAQSKFGIRNYDDVQSLIDAADVIDIVTPTLNHFDCTKSAIENAKHVFVEKPITNTVEEADELLKLIQSSGCKLQVGHVERFNPAFVASKSYIFNPMFIECHRLSPFQPRGTDVSVVLDLMIHDLDIILSLVNSPVKNIHASGVTVISDNPDIANARIEFENGCVANLTASRISMKTMRKSRFFQDNGYISVDFGENEVEVFQLADESAQSTFEIELNDNKKQFNYIQPKIKASNAIQEELISFANAIKTNSNTEVDINDGAKALKLAHQILDKIEQ